MIDEKKLIEEMAEEIENLYGRETELSEKAREYLNQSKEERYTIEQIVDAIVQADEEITVALSHKDREMLEDALKDFL